MYPRIILIILFPIFGFTQSPQKINFQSILRNTNGEVVSNIAVSLKISILSGSISGSSVYSETHTKTTDASGLISLQIGNGTVLSGVFSNISWGNAPHFIKLEADFSGGNNFVLLGSQELMSVPYALYASKTDTSSLNLVNRFNSKLNISDFPLGTTPGNIQYWNGTTWVNLAPGLPGQVISMSSTGMPSWSGAAYPTLTTSSASFVTTTSVSGGGNISSDGGAAVSSRGLVYGTSANPTLSNSVLSIGSGTGSFSGTISGLTPNTTGYIRAYATNSAGTGYGNEISFQTLPVAVPTLITTDASGITQTTVTSGGTVNNDGGATVTERGVVYGTSTNPSTSNTKVSSGNGTGSFNVNVTTLTPNTTYYMRSYATNSAGTGYGNNITFQTTVPAVPSLTTRELLNITNTTATGGGSITNDGGSSITAKGICWGTSPNPTISDSKTTDGTGTTTFTSFITGLSASATYYVRAYATNSTGTGYGNQQTFTASSTSNTLPVVTSTSVSGITTVQVTLNAEVNSQGGGTVTERGIVWNTNGNPTVNSNRIPSGSGTGVYSITLNNLTNNTNYYFRAYAINNFGFAYGAEIQFTTTIGLATITTLNGFAKSTTINSGGNITDNGGSTITFRGVVWNTIGNPTINDSKTTDGSGQGSFVSNLTSLSPSTNYYIRAYATNSTGTVYGNQITLQTTASTPTVIDIDGNIYNTVQIGNQIWMASNLKVTRYKNGTEIPYILNNEEWAVLNTGAWCYYNHNEEYKANHGALYNFYAISNVNGICPEGFSVPNQTDFNTLFNFIGGNTFNTEGRNQISSKLKSISGWGSFEENGSNETGFDAYPSGFRLSSGTGYGQSTEFREFGGIGQWWTVSGGVFVLTTSGRQGFSYNYLRNGNSLRCIKNN